MNKSDLRKQAALSRKELTPAALHTLSQGLCEQFATLDLSAVRTLHIFLPIAEKQEPDTFILIRWLQQHHPEIHILVPRADFSTALMTHHTYTGLQDLKKSTWQIPEPVTETAYTGEIDLVLVPLLAFDRRGYRVGYGKGFYDRFLQQHPAVKAGLSLFGPVADITDIHPDDVRLDLCITPQQIIRFGSRTNPVPA